MKNTLVLDGLTKEYHKGVKSLSGVSYEFTNGIYGLLGPNGAGKSTLMNIITDNLKPTSGHVMYGELTTGTKDYRRILGYVPQNQELYPTFSLNRFMYYMASLKGIGKNVADKQIKDLIEFVNLSDYYDRRLGEFSGGMKKRALVAQALLGEPKIIVLDEPTAGLDPKERIRIRNLISKIAFERIVIIATHVVTDIEFIAKEIILMNKGVVIDSKPPECLCRYISDKVYEVTVDETQYKDVVDMHTVSNISKRGSDVSVRVVSDEQPDLGCVKKVYPNMEDVYLYHFGEG